MYRFFITDEQLDGDKLNVSGGDGHHIRNVLRMKAGEDIEAVDAGGMVYTCRIESLTPEGVTARVLFSEPSGAELENEITLYMGLPKSDKMELIIQKAVELGAARIVPVVTARTIVKLDAKKAASRRERWQGIAEAAAMQSKRTRIPEVGDVVSFSKALEEAAGLDRVLIPYECAEDMTYTRSVLKEIPRGASVGVFIGPEGGFEASEVDAARAAGASVITLGRRILRCETAAITTLSILAYELE